MKKNNNIRKQSLNDIVLDNHDRIRLNNIGHLKPINESFDKEKPILVSIICNCFNQENYVAKCLDGFMMQLVDFNVEVLVHDDASTDKTSDIIKQYEKKYPNVIKAIYETENQYSKHNGIISRIQISRARGKYIAYCEGDDCWFDNLKLAVQVDFLNNNPDYVCCTHETIINNIKIGRFERLYGDYGADCDIPITDAIIWGPKHKAHLSSWLVLKEYVLADKPEFTKKYIGVGDHPLLIYYTIMGKVRFLNLPMSIYNMFSVETSWRVRNFSNSDGIVRTIKYRTSMFESLLTLFQEDDAIRGTIKRMILTDEFQILLAKKEYREALSKKYKNVYISLPFKTKIKIFIGGYLPFLLDFLQSIRHK